MASMNTPANTNPNGMIEDISEGMDIRDFARIMSARLQARGLMTA